MDNIPQNCYAEYNEKNHEKSNKKFIKGKGTNEDGKRKG